MILSIKNPYPTSYPHTYDWCVQSIRTKAVNGKIPKNRPIPPKRELMFKQKLNFQYGNGSYKNHNCHAISTKDRNNIIASTYMIANPFLPSFAFGDKNDVNCLLIKSNDNLTMTSDETIYLRFTYLITFILQFPRKQPPALKRQGRHQF